MGLLKSVPQLGVDVKAPLKPIGGLPPDLLAPPKGCRFRPRCPRRQAKCDETPPLIETAPGSDRRVLVPGRRAPRPIFSRAGGERHERNRLLHEVAIQTPGQNDDVILRITHLKKYFKVGGGFLGGEGINDPRGRRCFVLRPPRRDVRSGRRVRLRQDHAWSDGDPALRTDLGQHRLSTASISASSQADSCARTAAIFR